PSRCDGWPRRGLADTGVHGSGAGSLATSIPLSGMLHQPALLSREPRHAPDRKPSMRTKAKLLATAGVFLSSVACDQTTKELAVRELKGQGSIELLGGSARLVYAENP